MSENDSARAIIRTNDPDDLDFDALRAVTRLLIGITLVGTDEVLQRLQSLEKEMLHHLRAVESQTDDSLNDLLRFALIGLILDSQDKARQGFLAWFDWSLETSIWAYNTLTPMVAQSWFSPLTRPLERRLRRLMRQSQVQIDEWIRVGRREERYVRAIAYEVVDEFVDEFLKYLSDNPEVRDMIQAQSMDITSDLVITAREASISADELVENLVRRVLRRPSRETLPKAPINR